MSGTRKYTVGRKITSMNEVARACREHRYLMYGDATPRPMHYGWIHNMTFASVESWVSRGMLHEAKEIR